MNKKTLREHGITFGPFDTTKNNHLADLGIRIGHETIHEGKDIHTGVTIIEPHNDDVVREKAFAGFFCMNGYGKFMGSTQVEELGTIETLIGLTNTLAVGTVANGIVEHHVAETKSDPEIFSLNPIVGETNDGVLNKIKSLPIQPQHVESAIANLSLNNFAQGAIGAGSGTRTFAHKGGIGSSTRIIPKTFSKADQDYSIGILTQSNYGGFLRLQGKEIWKDIDSHHRYDQEIKNHLEQAQGSCVMMVATDAPLLPHQLKRLAARAISALSRTGSYFANGSGDYALAWSTNPLSCYHSNDATKLIGGPFLREDQLDVFFAATADAAEESIWNSMTTAETIEGYLDKLELLTCQEIIRLTKK
jgi:D-aminopeptidase